MEYRYLGNSGLAVSELCLGTMTFGYESDEAESHRLLDRFIEAGGNFIDTADVYAGNASEEIIGRWLAHRSRDDMVIATKAFWLTGDGRQADGAPHVGWDRPLPYPHAYLTGSPGGACSRVSRSRYRSRRRAMPWVVPSSWPGAGPT